MMDASSMTVLFEDNGLFLSFAEKIAPGFGKLYYFSPWDKAYPSSNDRRIGEGIPGIERVDAPEDVIDDCDLIIHSDITGAARLSYLRDHGWLTWGCGIEDSWLELARGDARDAFKEAGLPVLPGEVVIGMEAVKEYCKGKKDLYIKASRYRGDWETFHWQDDFLSSPELEKTALQMGANARFVEFLIEEALLGIEPGWDGYVVNNQFPSSGVWGFEVKDKAYIGKVASVYPPSLQIINKALPGLFTKFTGQFSHEYRLGKDRKPYLTDPCMRAGSPPTECLMDAITNWPEIIAAGSQGVMIQPMFSCKYVAEILLYSEWAKEDILPVEIPKEFKKNIKLRNYWINDDGLPEIMPRVPAQNIIGAAVGWGENLKAAITMAEKAVDAVRYSDKEIKIDLDEASKEVITEAIKYGVIF